MECWISGYKKLISFGFLLSAKSKECGDFTTKRFWMYFVYTKSMLAYLSFLSYFLILIQKYIYRIFQNKNFLEDIVKLSLQKIFQ